jgi:hypothetical protein
MVEKVHSCSTSAPLVAGNAVAFTLTMDVTMQGRGRVKLEEICAYEVKDGQSNLARQRICAAWPLIFESLT